VAENLKQDASRSVAWLRKSVGPKAPGPGVPGPQDGRVPLRELFTDLIAYVLFFQVTCEQRCPPFAEVRGKITAMLEEQERRIQAGEVPWESYREARFAVLAWVDEAILTSAWPHRTQWQHLMLASHGTLNAGEEFYERLKNLPTGAQDIREMYYLCLELGYLGEHALADSASYLRELRHGLYRQLSGAPNDIRQHYARLFPEAYRKPPGERPAAASRIHPIWYGLALLLPVVLLLAFSFILRREANRLIARIEAGPTVAPALPDLRACLVDELQRRGIETHETPRGMVVTLPGLLFEVNKSDLSPEGQTKMEEVARIVKRCAPERVMAVEGHASRERGTLDELNQRLSQDRATKAREILLGAGLHPEKVTSRGFGSSTPVASNDTEEGRRKNRRVEIVIEKTGN
jgi:type VI secretion system protein ImpK